MNSKLFFVCLFIIVSSRSFSQENLQVKTIDKLIETTVKRYQLPSLSLVVCKGDSLVYANAYGLKREDRKDSVNLHSKYYWASVSKTFTATAIMKLYEEGKLQLDDPVVRYYPELRQIVQEGKFKLDSITVRHLLSHTSGIPKFNRPWLLTDVRSHLPLQKALLTGEVISLLFQPGKKYHYSNVGMSVLGAIVEKLSGLSYQDYIKQNFFIPLGLNESTFKEVNNLTDTSLATLHVWDEQKEDFVFQNRRVYINGSSSGGALKMSPKDMSKWLMECQKIYNGQDGVIKQSTLLEMWSKQIDYAALGWDCDEEGKFWGLGPWVAKGGNLEWMSDSYIIIYPKKQLSIAICNNATSAGFDGKRGFAAKIIKKVIKVNQP